VPDHINLTVHHHIDQNTVQKHIPIILQSPKVLHIIKAVAVINTNLTVNHLQGVAAAISQKVISHLQNQVRHIKANLQVVEAAVVDQVHLQKVHIKKNNHKITKKGQIFRFALFFYKKV